MTTRGRQAAIAGGGLLLLCFALLAGFLGWGRFFFSTPDQDGETGQAHEQLGESLGGGRRNIYDRNYMELAVSFRRSSMYARPLELEQPEEVARQVARILGLDEKGILASLRGERSFSWLGRDLPQKKAEEIAELNFKGVYRMDQVHRYYPGGRLAAHVLGFLKDEQGLAGVEFYYDSVLRGGGIPDPRLTAAGVNSQLAEGAEGAGLVLTIDILLQSILEQRLVALAAATGARSAMAALMAPDTGEIIAMAVLPSYDPNRYWEYSTRERRNRIVEDLVEPGGVAALFHVAAALDRKAVPEKTAWDGGGERPEGVAPAGGSWTMVGKGTHVSPELLGLAHMAVDDSVFAAFIDEIGLTSRGEIDLPEALFALRDGGGEQGEARSSQPADGGMEIVMDEAPEPPADLAGHSGKTNGPAATPMTLLTAFSRLVNGGRVMTPHVLHALWYGGRVWPVPAREGERDYMVRPAVSQSLLSALQPWARGAEGVFVLESLQGKGEGSSFPPSPPAAGREPEAPPGGGAQESPRAQQVAGNSILLGLAPVQRPEVTMLIALEEAVFHAGEPSPARRLAQEMLPLARAALGKQPSLPSAKELAVREIAYYRKWEKDLRESEAQPALAGGEEGLVMPDVRGLSLRKAMQLLQPYGLKPRIKGTGRVARQSPQAGAPIKGNEQCLLELRVEQ